MLVEHGKNSKYKTPSQFCWFGVYYNIDYLKKKYYCNVKLDIGIVC